MIKHFNLDIMEKDSNKINIDNYLNLKFKNRDDEFIEEQTKRIKDHWNAKKEPERLIFGQAFSSVYQ